MVAPFISSLNGGIPLLDSAILTVSIGIIIIRTSIQHQTRDRPVEGCTKIMGIITARGIKGTKIRLTFPLFGDDIDDASHCAVPIEYRPSSSNYLYPLDSIQVDGGKVRTSQVRRV